MSEGGPNLWKWTTNSSEFLQQIWQTEMSLGGGCSITTTSVAEEEQIFAHFHTGLNKLY